MQFEKTYTREFFKDVKLHSSFGLVQFRSSLKNSLVHVFFQIALETILLPIQTELGNQKGYVISRFLNRGVGSRAEMSFGILKNLEVNMKVLVK